MHWIAIHENVLGSKLRGLRKSLDCSEAEALGILTILWLWARKNADSTGLLANTDREDIDDAIKTSISSKLRPTEVTTALVETGWIDEVDGVLYIHDWNIWQAQWYTYLDKREKDAERKRRERAKAKQQTETKEEPKEEPAPELQEPPEPEEPKKKPKAKKEAKPEKTKYADNVKMHTQEWDTLVERFGEEFTHRCIEELDNYKGSTGKTYKDDYRAILSWVVEKCERKYPNLKKKQQIVAPVQTGGNPFASFK